jgi:phage terminase large subunit GpA-like protein
MLNKLQQITNFTFQVSDILPSEYAEKNRTMTSEVSKFTGNFSYDKTPYVREIVDCLSPYSPVNVVALMKGLQIGASAGLIENGIAYLISENPTNIMLVSGNDNLASRMMLRIDQSIDTCGLRNLMRTNVLRKSRSSGDTAKEKQFAGGSLIVYSGQAINNMRQNSVEVIFADDVDMFKGATEGAGSFSRLMEGRSTSYGSSRKICYLSTPELKESSIIEPLFLQGDQRYWYVPCPMCGELIILEWYGKNEKGTKYGVVFDVKKNRVVPSSVRYRCQKCENEFQEKRWKTEIIQAGEWIPTTEPIAETFRSYNISALYAPIGMKNWTDYAIQFQQAFPRAGFAKEAELQAFNNTVLAKTWETKGKIPKITKLQNNSRNYQIGEVPFELCREDNNGEIIMLTCACDLNGVMDGEQGDDVRLDYEITAWSENGASYSIDAGSIGTFVSKTIRKKEDEARQRWTYRHNIPFSVWVEFKEIIEKEYSGMSILFTAVDTGHFTEYAMDFVKLMQLEGLSVYAFKGDKPEAFRMTSEDKQLFKKSKEVDNLYLINVNRIKDNVSNYMELEATDEYQPSNFMNFPNPSGGKYDYKNYFSHFEGEQRKLKKNANNIEYYLWERRAGRQNHFWDCKIYNYAIKDILIDMICKEIKVDPLWSNFCLIIKANR